MWNVVVDKGDEGPAAFTPDRDFVVVVVIVVSGGGVGVTALVGISWRGRLFAAAVSKGGG
jgi:hypothetical protein